MPETEKPPELPCARKRRFAREKDAKRAARKLRRDAIDWFRVKHYYCEDHKGWHIGSQPLRGRLKTVLRRAVGPW